MARRRADSGPSPTMRTCTSGIRSRSTAAARSKSSSRLRGYMRATASTVGRAGGRRLDGREAASPLGQIDWLGHHGQSLGGHAVDLVGHRRRVAAGHHDAIGAVRVALLPARLDAEERPHQPLLVPELVGDDPLEAHDEARARAACRPSPACPQKPVEIDADHDVGGRRGGDHAGVVEPPVERVESGARADQAERDGVAQALEPAQRARRWRRRSRCLRWASAASS